MWGISKFQPHSILRSVGKQWTSIIKKKWKNIPLALVPGLSVNFFFEFNYATLGGKLVQAVSRFQSSSPMTGNYMGMSKHCWTGLQVSPGVCVCKAIEAMAKVSDGPSRQIQAWVSIQLSPKPLLVSSSDQTRERDWRIYQRSRLSCACGNHCLLRAHTGRITHACVNRIPAALWRTSVAVLPVNSRQAQPAAPAGLEDRPESARRRQNPASIGQTLPKQKLCWWVWATPIVLVRCNGKFEFHRNITRIPSLQDSDSEAPSHSRPSWLFWLLQHNATFQSQMRGVARSMSSSSRASDLREVVTGSPVDSPTGSSSYSKIESKYAWASNARSHHSSRPYWTAYALDWAWRTTYLPPLRSKVYIKFDQRKLCT